MNRQEMINNLNVNNEISGMYSKFADILIMRLIMTNFDSVEDMKQEVETLRNEMMARGNVYNDIVSKMLCELN